MAGKKRGSIIAFTGKGGVGKTSISALTVRLLSQAHPDSRILAIDADPAVGLSTALGVEVASTVDDIRKLFIGQVEDGNAQAAVEMLGEAKFRLCDSMVEKGNISFLAIGRPEAAGCYCKVNAYLKEVISLVASNYDYVVIDGEAGIEQVNRRVMEKVDCLIMVSDASKKGLAVAKTIDDVAKELVMAHHSGLIVNRILDVSYLNQLDLQGLELLACIPDDKKMALSDMQGNSVFELGEDCVIVEKVKEALGKLSLL